LYAAALLCSAVLALRPDSRADFALDLAFAPTRWLAEACAPFRWIRLRSARAAETALVRNEEREHAARERLHAAERGAAIPQSPQLREGRRFVHAEVIERTSKNFDALIVRVDGMDCEGLEPGMPVVAGDEYIGRTARLEPPRQGELLVQLSTSREFAVGAALDALDETGQPIRCVVGGVAVGSRLRGDLRLALASPSRRVLPAADARVDELASPLAPYAVQAAGFRLGRVEATPRGDYAIVPDVDFRSGLFRLAIAAPSSIARRDDHLPFDPLYDSNWISARVLSTGQPNARREGFEISAGRWSGVREGAAFVVGARLIGRVRRAGPFSADVTTLADPGWSLHAVALAAEFDRPVILGALVALGRTSDDPNAVAFEWSSRGVSQGGDDGLDVQVFTGAGQPGVPSGLWLGSTRLPREPGVHLLRLAQDVDARSAPRGFVRGIEAAP